MQQISKLGRCVGIFFAPMDRVFLTTISSTICKLIRPLPYIVAYNLHEMIYQKQSIYEFSKVDKLLARYNAGRRLLEKQ